MIVVCNSSPLISLARVGGLVLLRQLFGQIHLADEVWDEVVVRGAGRPAAEAVRAAQWIERHSATPVELYPRKTEIDEGGLACSQEEESQRKQ